MADGRAAADAQPARRGGSGRRWSSASWRAGAQFYLISWLGNRVVFDLRNDMFRHLQTLSIGYVDRRGVGAIMTRIQNDVGVINEFFGDGIAGIFANMLILVGIVVAHALDQLAAGAAGLRRAAGDGR